MNTQIAIVKEIALFTLFFVPLLADGADEIYPKAEKGLRLLKEWNAIEKYESTRIDREPYNSDGKISKLELAHAGVQDLLQKNSGTANSSIAKGMRTLPMRLQMPSPAAFRNTTDCFIP